MLFWLAVANAADPAVVEVTDPGTVHGEVLVASPIDLVREKMSDPAWIAGVDASGTTVEIAERAGDCVVTDSVSPSIVKTVRYRVKRCPTADGWHGTLVSSNAFDAYDVRWKLTPDGAGTRLTYDIAVSTTLMVPQFVVDRQTRNGVEQMLNRLQGALNGDPGASGKKSAE